MKIWSVLVGNIGTIYDGTEAEARRRFAIFVKRSKERRGRAAGEAVVLLRDGDPYQVYNPHYDPDGGG